MIQEHLKGFLDHKFLELVHNFPYKSNCNFEISKLYYEDKNS